MPFTSFEPDPNASVHGWGTFTNDTGGKGYFFDPTLANELTAHQEAAAEQQRRNATANAFGTAVAAPAVPPPAGTAPVEPAQGPQALNAVTPPENAVPQDAPPPIDPREVASNALVQRAFSPVNQAARPGGFMPKSQTVTTETSGLPYSEEDAAVRADLNTNVRLAHQQKTEHEAAAEMAAAEGARAAMPEIQRRADEAQAVRDQQFEAYRAERAELQGLIDASAQKKVDPQRMFKNAKGEVNPVSFIGTVIAQAFGAYASTRWGGPNLPQEMINRAIDQDIAAQRHEYEASQGQVRNAFAMLNDRYRDANQAEAALRLAQHSVASNQVAAYAAASKAQGIQDAAAEWDALNLQKREELEEALRAAAMGKRTLAGTAAYQAPTAGGVREKTSAEINAALENAKKFNEVTGLEGDRKATKDAKGAEKQEKLGKLVVTNVDGSQLTARSEPEATKIREFEGGRRAAQSALTELEAMSGKGNWTRADRNKIRQNLELVANVSNSLQGQNALKGEDLDRYVDSLSTSLGLTAGGVDPGAVKNLSSLLDNLYQSKVDAQAAPQVTERQTTSGPQVHYTGQRAAAPTQAGTAGPKRVQADPGHR